MDPRYLLPIIVLSGACATPLHEKPSTPSADASCSDFDAARIGDAATERARVVCADIAALDQTLVYNRFGSFNPFGMIFALRRDLVPLRPATLSASESSVDGTPEVPDVRLPTHELCREDTGTAEGTDELSAGDVRLRDCKRPRPIVLRAGVNDVLVVNVTNLLKAAPDAFAGDGSDAETVVDFSRDLCGHGETVEDDAAYRDEEARRATDDANRAAVRQKVDWDDRRAVEHGEADCVLPTLASGDESGREAAEEPAAAATAADWPNTRAVNFVAQGLVPLAIDGEVHDACRGLAAVAPGESFACAYRIHQEGTYFFASNAAPAGGEGDGGSLVHGLFGAVLGEETGTEWYRSQVSAATLDAVWASARTSAARADEAAQGLSGSPRHARAPEGIDYHATVDGSSDGMPYLRMLRSRGDVEEIVHTDVNAIVYCPEACEAARRSRAKTLEDVVSTENGNAHTSEPHYRAFREFSVFFHDELKTFYTEHFRELGTLGQLAGVKDGFAINYGASGMGSILLANRKGVGPAASCIECLYEEFFLTSWANGDPALLEWYSDDPSNVHHSYLNDPVVFRNFHAGPKETHVFHLHAHQWFAGNDPSRGAYLDSQTVAPQQGFSYNIYHGGLRTVNGATEDGWWDTQGAGNRNRTVGDSIFHCHLYPHFAQGMWALWRVHDAFEDGTRLMPDGQAEPGLSTAFTATPAGERFEHARAGSVDRASGAWNAEQAGTPIPALVPLPGEALPLLPTYLDAAAARTTGDDDDDAGRAPFPGYPFYIPGRPGHRPPQAPLDIARALEGEANAAEDGRALTAEWLDGGIGRHLVLDGSTREPDFELPGEFASALADAPDEERTELARQLVAKSFALGNLTTHLTAANLELLDNEGERLERAAMGFHHDGDVFDPTGATGTPIATLDVYGEPAEFGASGYATQRAPLPDAAVVPGATDARFGVNGSPPRPGAPYADPCGVALGTGDASVLVDPTVRSVDAADPDNVANYVVDPLLLGFRRYEVSAVQLDMIVNGAGWHDPQARINVLTADAGRFKSERAPERVSPTISDREEPFFFRALSGECIEFRHTNELPKELALDDFQVKTPTDTIGQHIHLVKFDVTSSDGSGNGWNYEDGTFAPDELAARRCAASAGSVERLSADLASGADPNDDVTFEGCDGVKPEEDVWWRPLDETTRDRFQTTAQRWFADPVLTLDERGGYQDRTLRTVFTHDHFAPSSIQQHGFYAALVIEPSLAARTTEGAAGAASASPTDALSSATPELVLRDVCPPSGPSLECVAPLSRNAADLRPKLARGSEGWTGAMKAVRFRQDDASYHTDYREFALSIADFALLYDPRDRDSEETLTAAIETTSGGESAGMARLLCELRWRGNAWALDEICGNPRDVDGNAVRFGAALPAWTAAGRPGDPPHRLPHDAVLDDEVEALRDHLVSYRRNAAGLSDARSGSVATLAKPVAPPARPEAISVDHHDPYLVNYRNAPIPLRIGTKDSAPDDVADGERPWDVTQHPDCRPMAMARPGGEPIEGGVADTLEDEDVAFPECSIGRQRDGRGGDLAFAFDSRTHRDPETPLLEAFAGDKLVFRMIQGAQEVQHTFRLDGQSWQRNIDQEFPRGTLPLDVSPELAASPRIDCLERGAVGRPLDYAAWRDEPHDGEYADDPFWAEFERTIESCDNVEGYVFAQEIGISEHFELAGSLRSDAGTSLEGVLPTPPARPTTDGAAAPRDSSDYRFSFGSVDAMWNGAWGLMRIYRDENATDPATDPELNLDDTLVRATIGARLRDSIGGVETGGGGVRRAVAGSLTCPVPESGGSQRVVEALVAAVETRHLDPDGTVYRAGKTDRDGLVLALLPPDALGDDPDAATREDVHDALAGQTVRPFVLRVQAGDCVSLRFVNALEPIADDPFGGLPDRPGDALMPPIVPLNVGGRTEVEGPGIRRGRIEQRVPPASDVRPSAHLALSVHIPSMTLRRDVPSGAGYNLPALAPGADGTVTVSAPIDFYAGRVRLDPDIDLPSVADAVETALEAWLAEPDAPTGRVGDVPATIENVEIFATTDDGADPALALLSERYELALGVGGRSVFVRGLHLDGSASSAGPVVAEGCTGDAPCAALPLDVAREIGTAARRLVRIALDREAHWIPYAFGPVPVTAVSDVVSQPVHGLFGIVDVVPTSWAATGEALPGDAGVTAALDVAPTAYCTLTEAEDADACGAAFEAPRYRFVPATAVAAGDGAPALYEVEPRRGPPYRLREFVVFYQDGLNHWDEASAIDWQWADGGAALEDGAPIKPVPNCPVCDDSYDRGERGVSYRSLDFAGMLREHHGTDVEVSDDLNVFAFPNPPHDARSFFADAEGALRLEACAGERVVIRVVHPGGRARQRAFAMNGYNYDELFPGFGFPRSALLAPGKTITAHLEPAAEPGVSFWGDGPTHVRAGGVWGLLDVAADGEGRCAHD